MAARVRVGAYRLVDWADNGTYGVFDYRPPLGLDTALINHLASVMPRSRTAMERAQACGSLSAAAGPRAGPRGSRSCR
jgi:hypothetical protein